MVKTSNPIFFDIETGGLERKRSSILSVSALQFTAEGESVRESFHHPMSGTWLSRFSEETIVPQVMRANRTMSEKAGIQQFIDTLNQSPGANIVGYNSQSFDVPFLAGRAEEYGLGDEFRQAMRGRRHIDVGLRAKGMLGDAISSHIQRGTFSEQLGGRTWGQAQLAFEKLPYSERPPEYNALRQMESFSQNVERRGNQAVRSAKVRGWQLSQLYGLAYPESDLVKRAHESTADVKMTKSLYEAFPSGDFQSRLQDPAFARRWLSTTVEGMQTAPTPAQKGAGRMYYASRVDRAKQAWSRVPKAGRRILGAGAAALGLVTVGGILSSAFSGNADDYNTIEGMRHGGLASRLRRELTDFSSPADLGKAAARAAELYKSKMGQLLKGRKIDWMDVVDEGDVTILAKDADTGEALMAISREIMEGEVNLTSVEVSRSLRGQGIGKQFYEAEPAILREIGYEAGETVTSPVSSPVTARWQMQQYGSMPDAGAARRAGDLGEFRQRILSKQMSKEEFTAQGGYVLTGKIPAGPGKSQGRAMARENVKTSGDRTQHNTVEGMQHGGLGSWFRKLFTDFSSPADLAKAAGRAAELYKKNVGNVLEFAGFGKGQYSISTQVAGYGKAQQMNLVAKDMAGNELASISRKFSSEGVELTNIALGEKVQGIGAGRLLYEAEPEIFRKVGYSAGEQITSPSVISPITGRMQMEIYGAKVDGGLFFDETAEQFSTRLMAKEVSYLDMPMVGLVGKIPEAPKPALKVVGEQMKTGKQARAALNRKALETSMSAGVNGGRRSRMG